MPKPLATTTVRARFWAKDDHTFLPQDAEEREVTLELLPYTSKHAKPGEQIVQMRGGPTGHESFIVRPGQVDALTRNGWLANFGTGNYQRCDVSQSEMQRGMRGLGFYEPGVLQP